MYDNEFRSSVKIHWVSTVLSEAMNSKHMAGKELHKVRPVTRQVSLLTLFCALKHLMQIFKALNGRWTLMQTLGRLKQALTLKAPRKNASENVVCLCRLLNIFADFSNLCLHTGKQCGP